MRNLASIQKILELTPIEGKDKIELATILGWKVIVQKGMTVGDLVVYCEIDSILPDKPEYEFLRARCFSPKLNGHRIKTMKMGGVFSQGIVFPTSILPKGKYNEGTDVTDILEIRKYDPDEIIYTNKKRGHGPIFEFMCKFNWFRKLFIRGKGKQRGWPEWLRKTDETRVQAIPNVVTDYKDLPVYVTMKMDGQSATYAIKDKKFYVFSRNLYLRRKHKCSWWDIAIIEHIEDKLRMFLRNNKTYKNIAIQGEICGPNICGNKYNYGSYAFYLFSIYDIDNQKYVGKEEFDRIAKILRLHTVKTLVYNVPISDLGNNVDELVNTAVRLCNIDNFHHEGIVIRSMTGEPRGVEQVGDQFSFKVINPEFLVHYGL